MPQFSRTAVLFSLLFMATARTASAAASVTPLAGMASSSFTRGAIPYWSLQQRSHF